MTDKYKTKQNLILNKAILIILQDGIENISAQEICRSIPIRRTTLQHYYPKMTDLYLHIMESEAHRYDELKNIEEEEFGLVWQNKLEEDERFNLVNSLCLKLFASQSTLSVEQNKRLNVIVESCTQKLVFHSASLCLMNQMQRVSQVA